MSTPALPGRLGPVRMDGELPRREDLPLVSYAQWQAQHRDVFGAGDYDLVRYLTYADRLGLITANATTPYIPDFIDLSRSGPLVVEVPPGPTAGGFSDFWQREFGILGEMGPDRGQGGRHLVVPWSPRRAARGRATSRADSGTGRACTTSTSGRSSTNATGSTWRCSGSSGSRRAGPSPPTHG
jgi:uncharacterized protein DUF1254